MSAKLFIKRAYVLSCRQHECQKRFESIVKHHDDVIKLVTIMTSRINDFKHPKHTPDGVRTCLSLVTQIRDKIGRIVEEEGEGETTEESHVSEVEGLVSTAKQQYAIVNSLLCKTELHIEM